MSHKIITKPLTNQDIIDKSRHVTGIPKWARSSKAVGTLMMVLGWFTIPFEVVYRRDLGQRWFTPVNYCAGLILLLIVQLLQYLVSTVWENVQSVLARFSEPFSFFHRQINTIQMDNLMLANVFYFICIYMVMGAYHLFKIKWRNQANMALHSFDNGDSLIQGLSNILAKIVNVLATPIMLILAWLLPSDLRKGQRLPKLINDPRIFNDTIVEPGILLIFALGWTGVAAFWLYISSLALAVHAYWREMARKSKMLDMRDAKIEAQTMRELRKAMEENKSTAGEQSKKTSKPVSQPLEAPAIEYANLNSIIEEMQRELQQKKTRRRYFRKPSLHSTL